jgi:hypothetical protein
LGLYLLGRLPGVMGSEATCLVPDSDQLAVALPSYPTLEVSAGSLEVAGPALFGSGYPGPGLRDQVGGFRAGGLEQLIQAGLGLDQTCEVFDRRMILASLSRSLHGNPQCLAVAYETSKVGGVSPG